MKANMKKEKEEEGRRKKEEGKEEGEVNTQKQRNKREWGTPPLHTLSLNHSSLSTKLTKVYSENTNKSHKKYSYKKVQKIEKKTKIRKCS